MQLEDGTWHRFFIDAGVVFWRTVDRPDAPRDDGVHHDRHKDFGSAHNLIGRRIQRVTTVDLPGGGEIRIDFEGGSTVVLRNVDDQSSLVVENEFAAS
jgi:hypothetical protein